MARVFTANIARAVAPRAATPAKQDEAMTWVVFVLCFLCSALGVGISFLAFGPRITGIRMGGVGFVIAVVMLGISYGAKYANEDARHVFTPVDLIQYLSQGFLWPTTWPALADFLGVQKVIAAPKPPPTALLDTLGSLLALMPGLWT